MVVELFFEHFSCSKKAGTYSPTRPTEPVEVSGGTRPKTIYLSEIKKYVNQKSIAFATHLEYFVSQSGATKKNDFAYGRAF